MNARLSAWGCSPPRGRAPPCAAARRGCPGCIESWGAFVRTGNRNVREPSVWPRYEADTHHVLELRPTAVASPPFGGAAPLRVLEHALSSPPQSRGQRAEQTVRANCAGLHEPPAPPGKRYEPVTQPHGTRIALCGLLPRSRHFGRFLPRSTPVSGSACVSPEAPTPTPSQQEAAHSPWHVRCTGRGRLARCEPVRVTWTMSRSCARRQHRAAGVAASSTHATPSPGTQLTQRKKNR